MESNVCPDFANGLIEIKMSHNEWQINYLIGMLYGEEGEFDGGATGVATEFTSGGDDTMAWDYDGEWICTTGIGYSPEGFGISYAFCQFGVCNCLSIGDVLKFYPNSVSEFCSFHSQWNGELGAGACEIFLDLSDCHVEDLLFFLRTI